MNTQPAHRLPGEDPWVIPYNNSLLLILAKRGKSLSIRQFDDFHAITDSRETVVWQPAADCDHGEMIWAPELHRFPGLSDKWYIYFAACDGNNVNHRMYVLESNSPDPLGRYHELGKVYDPLHDTWAIDMTVFQHNGKLYGVWSGWETEKGDFPQNLYIAEMKNPWTISSERVLISQPEYEWEMSDAAVNEAPQVLVREGKIYLIYSADASWTCAYKLGLLTFSGGKILDKTNWKKMPEPVFEQGDTSVYGPGHASFVLNHNGDPTKNLIVYHSKKSESHGWEREIRYQYFNWDQYGTPVFGKPY